MSAPVVHTLHGSLAGAPAGFYARHGHKALLVAISHSQIEDAPPGVRAAAVVPNPIAVDRWPFQTEKNDYLLWIGRMDPVKGAHRAIETARLASRPLVLAGPVQTGQADYFHEQIEPQIDGDNGMLVADEIEMARAVGHIGVIDPSRCRESVRAR